jgi:hypothetical protein
MGIAFSNRCNICNGKGEINLNDNQAALYEWCEGYFDHETSTDWLEKQLKKLIEMRREEINIKKQLKK